FAPRQSLDRGRERARRVGSSAVDGNLVGPAQQRAEHAVLEQLRLREKADAAPASIRHERERQRIEIRDVVACEDRRAPLRDGLGEGLLPLDRPAQAVPQRREEDRLRGRIHRVHGSVAYEQMTRRSRDEAGIVVPLRSFTMAKARLADVLSDAEREALAREMAEQVVRAAASRRVAVVTSAPEVVAFANQHGCDILADPGSLDAAAAA